MGDKFRYSEQAGGGAAPVDGVSWHTAMEFCKEVNRLLRADHTIGAHHLITLPTEAQWEYACRAGTDTQWYFGDDDGDLGRHAWYGENSGGSPHPVGLKSASPWGLFDLYGNVAEWCLDDCDFYGPGESVDPCGSHDTYELGIVRGGDYVSPAADCRSASRRQILKENPFTEETGLRVVCVER